MRLTSWIIVMEVGKGCICGSRLIIINCPFNQLKLKPHHFRRKQGCRSPWRHLVWPEPLDSLTVSGAITPILGSDATVWFSLVLGWNHWTLNWTFGPVQAFLTEPLPYLVIVQVILYCRTWFQVQFNMFLNFSQVHKSSGSNFGSELDCGITNVGRRVTIREVQIIIQHRIDHQ